MSKTILAASQDRRNAETPLMIADLKIVAMLAGSDVDILPETLWATEETQNLPPDLDFNAMLDDTRVEHVLTPEQAASYNWGWLCWIVGTVPDKLSGWSLRGWQDADMQYSAERRAERELFAQCVNREVV